MDNNRRKLQTTIAEIYGPKRKLQTKKKAMDNKRKLRTTTKESYKQQQKKVSDNNRTKL